MKKRVAIVSLGYAWMPCEAGPSRFYEIAKMFAEHEFEVDVVTTDFQHFKKAPRDIAYIQRQNYPFHISFIKVPPYKKNIDIRRVYSNKVAVRRVIRYLKSQVYDVVYCSIPANDIAAAVGAYCKRKKIPFVVDIEDLWPEAMKMVVKIPVIEKFIFWYFGRDAEKTYRCADGVIGTSEDYTNRAFLRQNREIAHETVYVGCNLAVFDEGARKYMPQIEKAADEFWVTYAGSIGTSYDIRTMVLAAKEILEEQKAGKLNRRIHFQILGTGPLKETLEELAAQLGCDNVTFAGYVEYPKMAAYLRKSDVLVNSFVKGAPQSIVNKIGDYLAAGKPMINTLENKEFQNLVETCGFGCNIEPERKDLLAETILNYERNAPIFVSQGEAARKTAEEQFDRRVSYLQILRLVQQVMKESADRG